MLDGFQWVVSNLLGTSWKLLGSGWERLGPAIGWGLETLCGASNRLGAAGNERERREAVGNGWVQVGRAGSGELRTDNNG